MRLMLLCLFLSSAVYGIIGVDGFLISASRDSSIRIWKEASPDSECERVLRGHSAAVHSLCMVGKHLYSGSDDTLLIK